jgi:hypothetical protein
VIREKLQISLPIGAAVKEIRRAKVPPLMREQ